MISGYYVLPLPDQSRGQVSQEWLDFNFFTNSSAVIVVKVWRYVKAKVKQKAESIRNVVNGESGKKELWQFDSYAILCKSL